LVLTRTSGVRKPSVIVGGGFGMQPGPGDALAAAVGTRDASSVAADMTTSARRMCFIRTPSSGQTLAPNLI
jgi:hypothetical protein